MSQARKQKEIEDKEIKAGKKEIDLLGHKPNQDLYIREIDLEPPEIIGKNSFGLKRLVTDKIMTDSTHHRSGEIKK
jgi:hypothetical protein